MPFDGTDFQPLGRLHMSTEEKALRYADDFFSDESKWAQGHFINENGGVCIMEAMFRFRKDATGFASGAFEMARSALAVGDCVVNWNETCPDFATLKAHLRARIKYYEDKRLGLTA